jgi:ABC-type transporter Mla MlaB component|tara:strand:+ start:189 stop:374 length:186 start_codon:yes stop_codon:yes gene_type:complete
MFDLKEPEHIDPSGMRLLIQANKRSQTRGRRTELRIPPDNPVYGTLSLLQFEQFVPYADQI